MQNLDCFPLPTFNITRIRRNEGQEQLLALPSGELGANSCLNKQPTSRPGSRSRVGSTFLGAVEFETSDFFSLALLQVDLNQLKNKSK